MNGTRETLPVRNGAAVANYLFGDDGDNRMIQQIHIGGTAGADGDERDYYNNYPAMRQILAAFGILATPVDPHHHHFHLFLTPPEAQEIGNGSSLLAGSQEVKYDSTASASESGDLLLDARALLEAIQNELSHNLEEAFMPFVDLPYLPLLEPSFLMAQAPIGATPVAKPDRVVGVCHLAMNPPVPPKTAVNSISPLFSTKDYLTKREKIKVDDDGRTSVLKQPDHGMLIDGGGGNYYFEPEAGYLGKDQATILVEVAGMKIHMKYFFQVLDHLSDDEEKEHYCPKYKWRISQDGSGIGLAGNMQVDLKIADLPSGQLGLVNDSTLTLDDNAAGHGWFIDPTPWDNDEFLPTSNPTEWVAREGSSAYGKIDLLTVLLHEYGHVLGLEHTADAHDYMATTLQPGMRRTLTVDQQLELMALAGYFPTPESPSIPYGPTDPGAPLPFTRTSGSTRFGRQRDARLDALDAVPQYAIVANPKLTNPDFNGDTGWSTTGSVSFENGSAVALTGNVLSMANDIDSPLLSAHLVAGPQHGQVVLDTPDAYYNGEDRFIYGLDFPNASTPPQRVSCNWEVCRSGTDPRGRE